MAVLWLIQPMMLLGLLILDDRTIADMKAKRQRDRERDEALRQQEAVAAGEQTNWKKAIKQ